MRDEGRPLTTNAEWSRWGEVDPLYGVAGWDGKQRGGPDPWTDAGFYALGKSDWADFLVRWERYGLNRTSCVEIGCGAGRITAQLVKHFGAVHGVDVSKGMLDYARPRVTGATFHLTDGIHIPLGDGAVTAAFSSHVLQHLDCPEDSIPIFAEIGRVLAADCTVMIHLPLYAWPISRPFSRGIFEQLFRARQWLARQKATVDRLRGAPTMRGIWYEVGWLAEALNRIGFVDVEFLTFPVSSNRALHPFVLARKPLNMQPVEVNISNRA